MAKLSVVAGATSQSINVFVQQSTSTTGAGLTGLLFSSSNLTASYTFVGANCTAVAITLATLSTSGAAFSSGGFKEINSGSMPGLYRFDLPNAALASGKGRASTVMLSGATNMAPVVLEIELTGVDNQDATRMGMTALPNANANGVGGLAVLDSNSLIDVDVKRWLATAVTASTAGMPDVNVNRIGNAASAGAAGFVGVDFNQATNTTATLSFTGTTIATVKNGVTVSTNNDKTGYTLTQSFPSNFASLSIDGSGRVDLGKILGTANAGSAGHVGVDFAASTNTTASLSFSATTIGTASLLVSNADKSGYALTQSFPSNFSSLSIDGSGNVATTSNVKKNSTLSNFAFVMTTGTSFTPATGLTVSANRSLDGGAFVACANAPTELSNGFYTITLNPSDMDADVVALRLTSTGSNDQDITILTQP